MNERLSTWRAFVRWRRQRLPLLQFVGVAAIVALAGNALDVVGVSVAFIWVAALRLWDDVNSADADADAHPDRVVVVGPRALYARAAAVAVVTAMGAAAITGHLGFVAVVAFLAGLYAAPTPTAVSGILVLIKYPAMAWALADGHVATSRLVLLMSLFVIDEIVLGDAPVGRRVPLFVVTAVLLAFIAAEAYGRLMSLTF